MSDLDTAWAAGFFDGEGHIGVTRGKSGQWLAMSVAQSDRRPLDRFAAIFGGKIIPIGPSTGAVVSTRQRWRWYLSRRAEIIAAMDAMLPYLSEPKIEQYKAAREACPIRRRSRFDTAATR